MGETQRMERILDGISQPRQQRSRESFARVRSATLALLAEKGPGGVTIADVSERANVSVGTIYGRVGNRANLLRVVQEEELARIVESMTHRLSELKIGGENSVSGVIRTFVMEMQASSPSIRALVATAAALGELSQAGPASWRAIRRVVLDALREASDAPRGPMDLHWLNWVFEVIDSSTVHQLEAPMREDLADVDQFIDNLTRTVTLLMAADMTTSPENA